MHSRTYRGTRIHGSPLIYVELNGSQGQVLSVHQLTPESSLKVWAHSPTGFEWGYCGSGPAQLALAIVLDATGSPKLAERIYQQFKFDHVAKWGNVWEISSDEIMTWLATSSALQLNPPSVDDEDADSCVQLESGWGQPVQEGGPS